MSQDPAARVQKFVNWAPTPPRAGIDLRVVSVLAIAAGMYLAMEAISWTLAGPFFSYVDWMYAPSTGAVVRQVLAPELIDVLLLLGIVLALGWRRAVGFGGGVMSAWGTVPLAISCVLMMVGVAMPSIAALDLSMLGVAFVGLLVAALGEELMFRGFLLHGLSRRLGGVAGVGISSALFALAHLIPIIGGHQPQAVIRLVFLFGSGVFLARIRLATRSIWYPTGVHAFLNVLTLLFSRWGTEGGFAQWAHGVYQVVVVFVGLALWITLRGAPRASRAAAQSTQRSTSAESSDRSSLS